MTQIHLPPATFNAAEHGPTLWPLLGWPWNAKAKATARLFDGWAIARLAGVLGLSVRELKVALLPAHCQVTQVGELHITAHPLWLSPRTGGGFSAHTEATTETINGAMNSAEYWPAARAAEVLAVKNGQVLLRLMQVGKPDKLAWIHEAALPQLWQRSIRA